MSLVPVRPTLCTSSNPRRNPAAPPSFPCPQYGRQYEYMSRLPDKNPMMHDWMHVWVRYTPHHPNLRAPSI